MKGFVCYLKIVSEQTIHLILKITANELNKFSFTGVEISQILALLNNKRNLSD